MAVQNVLEYESQRASDRTADPVVPHPVLKRFYATAEDRNGFVRSLFNHSAPDYNRIESVTSLGTGRWYRRKSLLEAGLKPGMRMLDVGCGTGLVAIPGASIVGFDGLVLGVDPNEGMRDVAATNGTFEVVEGVAEDLPVDTEAFDIVTMGYALRHVEDLRAAFSEFTRVLAPGGTALILEITPPRSLIGRTIMKLVMRWIVPAVSALATLNTDAWKFMRYAWETIDQCVPPDRVLSALEDAGFVDVRRTVNLGVFSAYSGRWRLDNAK